MKQEFQRTDYTQKRLGLSKTGFALSRPHLGVVRLLRSPSEHVRGWECQFEVFLSYEPSFSTINNSPSKNGEKSPLFSLMTPSLMGQRAFTVHDHFERVSLFSRQSKLKTVFRIFLMRSRSSKWCTIAVGPRKFAKSFRVPITRSRSFTQGLIAVLVLVLLTK